MHFSPSFPTSVWAVDIRGGYSGTAEHHVLLIFSLTLYAETTSPFKPWTKLPLFKHPSVSLDPVLQHGPGTSCSIYLPWLPYIFLSLWFPTYSSHLCKWGRSFTVAFFDPGQVDLCFPPLQCAICDRARHMNGTELFGCSHLSLAIFIT